MEKVLIIEDDAAIRVQSMMPNSKDIKLVEPTVELKSEFVEMAREFHAEGDNSFQEALQDFDAYIEKIQSCALGKYLPENWVRANEYWLINKGSRLLGKSGLRHELTESLKHEGGHIGYRIRPAERKKGYGTLLLGLTLENAETLGLTQVLVTCDKSNIASRRVIEKNGGVLENEVMLKDTGKPLLRYWIDLTDGKG